MQYNKIKFAVLIRAAGRTVFLVLPAVFFVCVQQSWTTLAGVSPVTVIASEPCS